MVNIISGLNRKRTNEFRAAGFYQQICRENDATLLLIKDKMLAVKLANA